MTPRCTSCAGRGCRPVAETGLSSIDHASVPEGYLSAMSLASAMVGNSSSGIVEAAPFKLPVVNIGTRQKGRTLSANIINSGYDRAEVMTAIRRATSESFRLSLADLKSPYGDGHAAERIIKVLKEIKLDHHLLTKAFQDFAPRRGMAS